MRRKMVDIFVRNFPDVKGINLTRDDMINFLMHYCTVTFDSSQQQQQQQKGERETNKHSSEVSPVKPTELNKREQQSGQKNSTNKNDTDVGASQKRHAAELRTKNDDLPNDAITVCRQKLMQVLPKKDESPTTYQKYFDAAKTLRTVIFAKSSIGMYV